MPVAEFRVFVNNASVDEELLDRFTQIRVDEAIGMATEAELNLNLLMNDTGDWSDLGADFAQPMQRVRVEVRIGTGDYVPLIDGPVVTQRFDFDASPGSSGLTLMVQDDSVLLNQDEDVELFEDQTPDQIASRLMGDAGMEVQADAVEDAGSTFTRYVVRRGTPMRLLRELAKRHGMFVYVRPGEQPGTSMGYFVRPDLTPGDLPELLVMGEDRNVNQLSIEFDALRPTRATAGSVRLSDKEVLNSETDTPDLNPLGDTAVHDIVTPGRVLLAGTREEESDLAAATQAAVNSSSWAYSAQGEVAADIYDGVLQTHKVVQVAGVGDLGGNYLISRVTHLLDSSSYVQRFVLVRNARLNGSAPSIPGGVF